MDDTKYDYVSKEAFDEGKRFADLLVSMEFRQGNRKKQVKKVIHWMTRRKD